MTSVDAFVVSVPKDKVEGYRSMLSLSAMLWKESGAFQTSRPWSTTFPTRPDLVSPGGAGRATLSAQQVGGLL
jgi:uncharacterized protein YbaA (DUF1428 family)